MNDEYEYDEGLNGMADILDALESDESDESDEARRRGPTPRVPSGRGLYRTRPGTKYVTQVQLQAALARVGAQIKTSSDATKAVSTRVNQEIAARKKDTTAIKKDIRKARDNSILPLLLQKPPELESIKFDDKDPTKVVEAKYKKSTDMLLPLILLMGGMGGGEGKDDDNSMMLLAVAMMSR